LFNKKNPAVTSSAGFFYAGRLFPAQTQDKKKPLNRRTAAFLQSQQLCFEIFNRKIPID